MNIFSAFNRTLRIELTRKKQIEQTPTWNWHEDFIVQLASILRPKVYIELGLWKCDVFNRVCDYADELYGIDVDSKAGTLMKMINGKTNFFCGTTVKFAEQFKNTSKKIDFIFIDADHSERAVQTDFELFFPMLSDQGIIAFHDAYPKDATWTDQGFCGDGYKFIARLSAHTSKFEVMTIPVHPGIALLRKRQTHLPWDPTAYQFLADKT